jgi:signal transduction histidine kinase
VRGVRLSTGEPRHEAFDAVLATVLLVASLVDLFTHALGGVYPHSTWAHLPFVVVTSLPVAFRRRWPLGALIVLAVTQSAWIYGLYPMDQQPPLVPFLQMLVVVYTAAAYSDGRAARAAWVVIALGIGTDIPTLAVGKPLGNVAGPDISLLIAFSVGLGFARIRRRADAQEQRATRAEQERLEAVARAGAEERARIARELHDVISHDVSLMVLQASVERRVHTGDDSTSQTLANIESTGREALAELRRMLGVLRKTDEDAPLRPQPGLAQLPELVEQARAAGLPVHLVVDGDPIAVPAGLDIAAYRIVQESLTNAAKHAVGATVTATVRYSDGALEIDVTDDGSADPATATLPRGGHGLVGMQERVALFGGSLEAAAAANGGFRVRARLPLPA